MTPNGQEGNASLRSAATGWALEQARSAFRGGDFGRTAQLCRHVLEEEPGCGPAIELLAAALKETGGLRDEIGVMSLAIDLGAEGANAYSALGELQRVAGDTTEAAATLRRAADADPGNPAVHASLGIIHYFDGELAEAEAAFRRALELDLRSVRANYFLGNIHSDAGDRSAAMRAYSAALEVDADYPPACVDLAQLLFSREDSEDRIADLERAAELMQRAIASGAHQFDCYLLAGKILLELERFEDARDILEAAAEFGDRHPDHYVALSVAYAGLKRWKKAREISLRLAREFPMGSRRAVSPQAEVLVLESLNGSFFASPLYGSHVHAHENAIGVLPPDRVSLHHVFLEGLSGEDIESYGNRYDVVYNNVANAEYNVRLGWTKWIRGFLDQTGLPLVNPPGLIELTARDTNYQRLCELDHLIFPKTMAFELGAESAEAIYQRVGAEFEFPVLVRRAGPHEATGLRRADNPNALRETLAGIARGPCYAIQYHESRHTSGAFLRYRVMFVGGRFFPGRMNLSEKWLVAASRTRPHERNLIAASGELQDEEKRWLANPQATLGRDNMAALHALHGVIGLDCYGVDIGIAGDGRVIVFEANACMNLLSIRRHAPSFPYLAQAAEDIKTAIEDLLISRARAAN